MHLIGPDIGLAQRDGCALQSALHVSVVDQFALSERLLGERILGVLQRTHARPRLPVHHQLFHGLLGMLLALAHHPHKVPLHHDRS